MLSRKNDLSVGLPLPESWTNQVQELLSSIYRSNLELHNRFFDICARIFENEIVLIVGVFHVLNTDLSPTTLFLSLDVQNEQKADQKMLNLLVDATGIFLDQFFEASEWDEYSERWTEFEHQKNKLFYKINRENVALTLKANELLDGDSWCNKS